MERTSRPNLLKDVVRPKMCERHFVKEDYLPDNISRKTGKVVTKRLDRNRAIPSRNLGRKFDPVKLIVELESNHHADFDDEDYDDLDEDTVSQNIKNIVFHEILVKYRNKSISRKIIV